MWRIEDEDTLDTEGLPLKQPRGNTSTSGGDIPETNPDRWKYLLMGTMPDGRMLTYILMDPQVLIT
jgi:hypothetical protein